MASIIAWSWAIAVAGDLTDVAAPGGGRHARRRRRRPVRLDLAPAPVVGDADRLHQVALNLLSDAAKVTPPAGTISVRTWAGGDGSHLQVDDTGPGLGDGEAERVFDRFWQGRAARATAGPAWGWPWRPGWPPPSAGRCVRRRPVRAHHARPRA